ncbi:hypothetical protein EWH08_04110 [Sphingobium indicum]|uniref:Uncharacterized protein n=2 Tax=Sphingobium indicum TaxID=332055 RepID=A0A1L5BTQ5_SPHIB|nr:hypothetical protein [Sphingobium indicum]APL96244.1 hypothetical protein SIDU_04910 [Sphingobium indicum B90A]KEY97404.1 hypothetical protein AI27_19175 [Sphingomonas sp. BHC-A]NYI21531.1 hypothetical protein [Sphingobium indicum]RYM03684.1 hypothetical protein EWH08_04110 [Sphingobium indicum]
MIPRRLLPSLILFLSGCASTFQGYPSLAKRAIEDAPIAEAAPAPSPVAPEPELVRDVDRLKAQAEAGGAAFDQAWPAADGATRAAAGSAVSSEAWVAAQTALSALETARNGSVSALASLDVLYVERSNAVAEGKVSGGIDAIDAARGAALAIVDGQNDRLDALKGRLAQP